MINKKDKSQKRILIVFLIVIAGILAILLCLLHMYSQLKKNNVIVNVSPNQQEKIRENADDYTIEDILTSYGCDDISYEVKKDENGESYYEINTKFAYNLYNGNESEEDYFDGIVETLEKKIILPFKVTDIDKNIEIYVDKDNNIYTINNTEDYYENNEFVSVYSHEVKREDMLVKNSEELNFITINKWSRYKLKLNAEPESISSEFIDYGTFKMNYTGSFINYIIYDNDYTSEVIDGIKVGTSFKDIKNKLGDPYYTHSNDMIGYRTEDSYVFFYSDQIVVYAYKIYENYQFEKDILKFYNGEYDGYRTNFVRDILDTYDDFKSESIDGGVKLYSYSRGIELYLYDNGKNDIKIYDNYIFGSILKPLAATGKLNLNFDEDAVYLYELNRKY